MLANSVKEDPTPKLSAPMTSAVHVRAVVRNVLDTSDSADPDELAAMISKLIPDEHLRDAFQQILPQIVRHEISLSRMRHSQPNAQSISAQPCRPTKNRTALIREDWQRQLAQRYPGVHHNWKFLRDFTAEDCDFSAAVREKEATQLISAAQRLRRLGQALREHKAEVVGDLPEEVLRGLLN